jgi:hypothetical protein
MSQKVNELRGRILESVPLGPKLHEALACLDAVEAALPGEELFLVMRHDHDPWDKGANDAWVPVGWTGDEIEANRQVERLTATKGVKHKWVPVSQLSGEGVDRG